MVGMLAILHRLLEKPVRVGDRAQVIGPLSRWVEPTCSPHPFETTPHSRIHRSD
jgi:hypothetical protein